MESSGESSVIAPLLAIEREDLTGVLEFSALGVTTNIYARSGEIVFAEGGTIGETLGRMFIRAGRLTEEQVAAVLHRMTNGLADGRPLRFGDVLLEYGFLEEEELDLALTQQVKEKLIGCVFRGPARWQFSSGDPRVDRVGSHVVRTRPMLVEAASHLPERRLDEVLHLDENRYPEIVAPETIVAAEFELTKSESLLLRDLDGTSSIHFILSKAGSPEVMPLLAALVLGGGVELKTAPTNAQQASESRPIPPEFRTARRARLGLPERGTAPMSVAPAGSAMATGALRGRADVPTRPPTASARLSAVDLSSIAVSAPERRSSRLNLAPAGVVAQDRAREAIERLATDLDRQKPGNERGPAEPRDDRERRLMAESAFHQGRLFLHAEQAAQALPGLHRAFELCPEQHEYELYAKWARMLVNDTFAEDGPRREMQMLAAKLVKEDRACDLGFSILGHCAKHDGKEAAALRFFRRAATLDPKLVDAARLARLLSTRAAGESRRPSIIDAQRRSRARGLLDAPLDEIVPRLSLEVTAANAGPIDRPPLTNEADAKVEDGPVATMAPPAMVPGPASPDGTIPAPPSRPPAPSRPAPSRPPTPSGPAPSVRASAGSREAPRARPKRRRTGLLTGWIASLALTAVGAYGVGAMATFDAEPAITTTEGALTPSPANAKPTASIATATATATATASVATTASVAPPASITPPTSSSSAAASSTAASSALGSTTGILRTLKGHGRRVYVDGRVIGEGGRDHTIACGRHRIRVGSTGVERSVTIPCGGTIELD